MIDQQGCGRWVTEKFGSADGMSGVCCWQRQCSRNFRIQVSRKERWKGEEINVTKNRNSRTCLCLLGYTGGRFRRIIFKPPGNGSDLTPSHAEAETESACGAYLVDVQLEVNVMGQQQTFLDIGVVLYQGYMLIEGCKFSRLTTARAVSRC